jgi:hypothetical protein
MHKKFLFVNSWPNIIPQQTESLSNKKADISRLLLSISFSNLLNHIMLFAYFFTIDIQLDDVQAMTVIFMVFV